MKRQPITLHLPLPGGLAFAGKCTALPQTRTQAPAMMLSSLHDAGQVSLNCKRRTMSACQEMRQWTAGAFPDVHELAMPLIHGRRGRAIFPTYDARLVLTCKRR